MKPNLNSILSSIVLAVLLWVGNGTWQNSLRLAEISGSIMPRQEIEAKLAATWTDLKRLDLEIQELKLEFSKLRYALPK